MNCIPKSKTLLHPSRHMPEAKERCTSIGKRDVHSKINMLSSLCNSCRYTFFVDIQPASETSGQTCWTVKYDVMQKMGASSSKCLVPVQFSLGTRSSRCADLHTGEVGFHIGILLHIHTLHTNDMITNSK